ncbi:MAG: flavodoxin domain-containing protein [Bacteroidetes bacterium]|nr:flavodoxin domain-containing protein [Bacteroidota bacterium]
MKDFLIVFYSQTGSNRFLAEKLAQRLQADLEMLQPRIKSIPVLLLLNKLGLNPGIRPLKQNPEDFKKIVLMGPVWMGQFVIPLKAFIKQYNDRIHRLYFATCCGSYDEVKDDKFGYEHVFKKIKALMGEKCVHCEALPIALVLPDEKKKDGETIMNTRLTDQNFKGAIAERFEEFVEKLKET